MRTEQEIRQDFIKRLENYDDWEVHNLLDIEQSEEIEQLLKCEMSDALREIVKKHSNKS
jgi:hypothetical protein